MKILADWNLIVFQQRLAYVEFGTSKMSAKPYMKPAFDNNKDDIENFFIETLKKKVK